MASQMKIANGMGMPLGIILGFIDSNLGKISEEKLRAEIEKNVHMMAGWLEGPKHDFD